MPASPDQLVVLLTRGRCRVESFSGGAWRAAEYRPGTGGLTAGGNANRLRWSAPDDRTIETLNVYVPRGLVDATLDEYRRAGSPARADVLDVLFFDDPVIARVCVALTDAAAGAAASELYAQSAAQFIVTHLLSLQSRSAPPSNAQRSVGSLPRRRLDAVLDYMAANYARQLTLDELAREAHVSRFHFVQLFRQEVGVTPHQHLIALRLGAATRMLLRTDSSVHAIAEACGYATGAHFAKAFGRRYGSTPSAYRSRATVGE